MIRLDVSFYIVTFGYVIVDAFFKICANPPFSKGHIRLDMLFEYFLLLATFQDSSGLFCKQLLL